MLNLTGLSAPLGMAAWHRGQAHKFRSAWQTLLADPRTPYVEDPLITNSSNDHVRISDHIWILVGISDHKAWPEAESCLSGLYGANMKMAEDMPGVGNFNENSVKKMLGSGV